MMSLHVPTVYDFNPEKVGAKKKNPSKNAWTIQVENVEG